MHRQSISFLVKNCIILPVRKLNAKTNTARFVVNIVLLMFNSQILMTMVSVGMVLAV